MKLYKAVKDYNPGVYECPNISHYKTIPPRGYILVREYWVDKIHHKALLNKVKKGYYYAITREGPFQLYIGEFIKKGDEQ